MENKIFIGQLTKMFPETKQQQNNNTNNKKIYKQEEYRDELDLVDNSIDTVNKNNGNNDNSISLDSAAHQISAIEFN